MNERSELILRSVTSEGQTFTFRTPLTVTVDYHGDHDFPGAWALVADDSWGGWDFVGFGDTVELALEDFATDFAEAWRIFVMEALDDGAGSPEFESLWELVAGRSYPEA